MKGTPLYIKIDKEVDGKRVTSLFPSPDNPVVLDSYTYEAKRMGGAPTITDSFDYPRCLDKEFTYEEYVEFEGEKFYVTSIPSSKKENTSELYKHDITLTSRRSILDNTLFFDVVTADTNTQDKDRYRSNQTKFTFGGDIYEFVKRINDSLVYTGLYKPNTDAQGFHVVIDEGYGTDEVKELSFDDQYITNVLQEIYNTFELTYYWVGDVCHVGKQQNDLTEDPRFVIEYGRDKALLSVSKENSNTKLIDIITGYGSSDNIPFYYPNDDAYGKAVYSVKNVEHDKVSIVLSKLWQWNTDCFNRKMILCSVEGATADVRTSLEYSDAPFSWEAGDEEYDYGLSHFSETGGFIEISRIFNFAKEKIVDGAGVYQHTIYSGGKETKIAFSMKVKGLRKSVLDMSNFIVSSLKIKSIDGYTYMGPQSQHGYCWEGVVKDFRIDRITIAHDYSSRANETILKKDRYSNVSPYTFVLSEDYWIQVIVSVDFDIIDHRYPSSTFEPLSNHKLRYELAFTGSIIYKCVPEYPRYIKCGDSMCSYDTSGVVIEGVDDAPFATSKFVFGGSNDWWQIKEVTDEENAVQVIVTDRIWISPSSNLMPSIYRKSLGGDRFYPAKKSTYLLPGSSTDYYVFKNEYKEDTPHQGSVSFDDIKPTIKGIRNDVIQEDGFGQLFGEVADVAFDVNDNDVMDSDNNYLHPYFYIKLHKFSGEFGFDLFAHALASDKATINMIDCQGCPACAFEIQCVWSADKNKCYNCVSVDENGNLKSLRTDSKDYILSTDGAQNDTLNQNTMNGEIWIAVQKDNSTLGVVMPNASAGFKPKKGDLFVLTGIEAPLQLTTAAEKRLDEALVKHMSENNEDQFTYKVNFSRIYLAENPEFTERLNENTKLTLSYNEEKLDFFVSNISLKCDDSIIANIEVELSKSLEVTQSDLKQAIDSVKGETVRNLGNLLTNTGSFNAGIADKMYLSKVKEDIAQATITFLKGIIFGNRLYNISSDGIATLKEIVSSVFNSGALGSGFKLGTYGDTEDSYLEVDRMLVRKAAEFVELVIRELRSVGGEIILTPASMKCTRVVAYSKGDIEVTEENGLPTSFYRCYFQQEADGKAVTNEFVLNDLVRCQQFNIKEGTTSGAKNRYYWRKCVGKSEGYIDLSATDCDTNSDAPMAGDELVQLGNSADATRQSAILLSAYGDDAPSVKLYRDINSYTLTDNNAVAILSRKEVKICADVLRYRTSSGNVYAGVDEQITAVNNTANDAKNKAEELGDTVEEISGEVTTVSGKYTSLSADVNGIKADVKAVKTVQNSQGKTISELGTSVKQTNDAITQEVNERTEYVNGQVTELTSKINQTATEISMQVAQNSNTMNNLIVGSALRTWDTITDMNSKYPTKCYNDGVGGSRYAKISVTGATAPTWAGFYFADTLMFSKKGVKCSYSVWVRVNRAADDTCYIYVRYKASATGSYTTIKVTYFDVKAASGWTLYKDEIEVPTALCYLQVVVCVRTNGSIDVCRPMLNEGDYIGWSMSPNDVTEAGNLKKDVKATGIDIVNKKITVTADKFEVCNNNGDTTASVNAKGVLEVNSGLFTGFVKKKPTVITPDNFDFYKSSRVLQRGYVEIDFDKAGSFLVFQGDLATKLGSDYIALTLPCTGTSWTTTDYTNSEHPLAYIGQRFVLVNQSTRNIVIAGGGTIRKNNSTTGSNIVEKGEVAVIECALTTSYSTSGNTYKAAWNGTIYKQ